jgi:hypothetical protein
MYASAQRPDRFRSAFLWRFTPFSAKLHRMQFTRKFPGRAGILFALCLLPDLPADAFPVAPLPREKTDTWGKVFRLSNRHLDAIISPDHDGIVFLSPHRGENALNAPVRLLPDTRETLTGALPVLEGIPQPRWQARGWITSEGGQSVLLSQTFGEPVHLRVSHLLTLPEQGTAIQWTARITAIAPIDPMIPAFFELPSGIPVWRSVWKIENGPELAVQRETTETLLRETLASPPGFPDLPPQGWTLLIEGTLGWPDPELQQE